jgi:glycine dehydrogenase subunit 1
MRYLPHTGAEIDQMLKVIGVKNVDGLFASIPDGVRLKGELKLPPPMSEPELLRELHSIAGRNRTDAVSFLGAGAYRHFIPAAVKAVASRSEFVTPYTPYQPEISQGTLQTIFEYQSMMCRLFAMDVSNASHYDGATAAAEAALLALRATRRSKILIADTVHPEYRETIATMLRPSAANIVLVPHDASGRIDRGALKKACDKESAGLIVGYPNFFGVIDELADMADIVHNAGGLFITSTPEPVSLGIIEAPGNLGADIACAEGQAFGCGLNFGGPNLGIFTAKEKFLRQMPGRIVGRTLDSDGRTGYVLTFATREQHIRREKATSNICSNEALCATTAAIYLSLLGKEGLTKLAELNYAKAEHLKTRFTAQGFGPARAAAKFTGPTFNEFVINVGQDAEKVLERLAQKDIFAGVALGRWYPQYKNCILICVTEENTKEEMDKLIRQLQLCF